MPSALTFCHTGSSTWRASQAKRDWRSESFLSISANGRLSSRASSRFCSRVACTSFGIAHTEGTATDVASRAPWRSVMRPRLPGMSSSCA
jgi:hypothetical protein